MTDSYLRPTARGIYERRKRAWRKTTKGEEKLSILLVMYAAWLMLLLGSLERKRRKILWVRCTLSQGTSYYWCSILFQPTGNGPKNYTTCASQLLIASKLTPINFWHCVPAHAKLNLRI